MGDLLNAAFARNTLREWLLAIATMVLVALVLSAARTILAGRAGAYGTRRPGGAAELLALLLRRTWTLFIAAVAVDGAMFMLPLPDRAAHAVAAAATIVILLQVGVWGSEVISFVIARHITRRTTLDAVGVTTVSALGVIAKVTLFAVVVLLALDNVGVRVTALVAGLGIGGIAVGLAAQSVLGDLFAAFAIVLDKPFLLGDLIVVNQHQGTVEHIGLKTTRIRSVSGEEIVFSNAELLKNQIHNYKRMYERRVAFSLGVTYDTPSETLARVPTMLEEIIARQPQARFARAHFKTYGDFALRFEIVYYVTSPDYRLFMDIQHAINLDIHRRFAEEGIEFAYPTQTVYVMGRGARPDTAATAAPVSNGPARAGDRA